MRYFISFKKIVYLIVFLFFIPILGLTNEFKINVKYNSVNLKVGGVLEYKIDVSLPHGLKYVNIVTNITKADIIIDLKSDDENKKNVKSRIEKTGRLQVFEINDFIFGGFILIFKDQKNKILKFPFGACPIYIKLPVINSKKKPPIRDVYGPLDMSSSISSVLLIMIFLVIIITVLIIYYIYKKKNNNQKMPGLKEIEDPWQLVLRRLEKIRNIIPEQPENIKEYFFLLTETVRMYLTGRTGKPFLEATTNEVKLMIKDIDWIMDNMKTELLNNMILADMVKFAKHIPPQNEIEIYYDFISEWLKKTEESFTKQIESEQIGGNGG